MTSIIISTYNKPEWLRKTLLGYAYQDDKDFELVIADDGSNESTKKCIDELRPLFKSPILHIWHEDIGFRKCLVLNKAILASNSDYIIFTDGDCIPRKDFVATHMQLRSPGRFLSGGYHKLPMKLSEKISDQDIKLGKCFNLSWLRSHGLAPSIRNLKVSPYPFNPTLLDHVSTARASWNGHNASGWKSDFLSANGFDNRMEYGGLDREFGERLENAGITGLRVRYRAICLHLDHSREYAKPEKLAFNNEIRRHTKDNKSVRTEFGINEITPEDSKVMWTETSDSVSSN